MSDASPLARLKGFLDDLTPEARARLISELERACLAGGNLPGSDMILDQLRVTSRDKGAGLPRVGNPGRLFFAPLEPFLVNEILEHKFRGRLCRSSLGPIWAWMIRDLLPVEAKSYTDQLVQMLLVNDVTGTDRLVKEFQVMAVKKIDQALARAQDGIPRQKLAAQLGGPRIYEDLRDMVGIFNAHQDIVEVAGRLPEVIRNLGEDTLLNVKKLLESAQARQADVFPYMLVSVYERMSHPVQLVRLAIHAADSDQPHKIAATHFAPAVELVFWETERLVARLRMALRSAPVKTIVSHVKEFHDNARLLRTEIDLSSDHVWSRRMAHLRTEIATLLKDEIEALPGRMRRLLRARPANEFPSEHTVDTIEVQDIENQIELLGACRSYAGEIALNEVTLRVYSELQNYLETGTQAMIEGLRSSRDFDRNYRISQLEAAIRFCARIFGNSYATLLQKSAEVAISGDRKQANL